MRNIQDYITESISISNNGCWEWNKCITKSGYGTAFHNGKKYRAHRLSYIGYKGDIPDGLCIDHLCRNRKCVNPSHLEAVTCKENIKRGNTGLHNRIKTHCKIGHELSPENTYIHPKSRGRECRICKETTRKRSENRRMKVNLPTPPSLTHHLSSIHFQ